MVEIRKCVALKLDGKVVIRSSVVTVKQRKKKTCSVKK